MNNLSTNSNAHGQVGEDCKAIETRTDFIYPQHDTQAARLLASALLGQKINPLRGWVNLGIYRLSDTKFRLKEMGWPMEADRLDVENRFGEACHVALYGLPDQAIKEAGELGQAFALREMEFMARRRAA